MILPAPVSPSSSRRDRRRARSCGAAARRLTTIAVLVVGAVAIGGCQGFVPHDTASLLIPTFRRSEIVGFVAGFGTTFAAVPDLLAMFRRRSSAGMNPRMVSIMAVFQVLWIYYGLLILSRPVIAWNTIAVGINLLTVAAYFRFARRESSRSSESPT